MLITKEMRWDKNIKEPEKMIDDIRHGKAPFNVYLICTAANGKTEIISCKQAIKPFNKPEERRVIGAAVGKQAAFDMLAEIYAEKL